MPLNPHLGETELRSPTKVRPGGAAAVLIHGRGQRPQFMVDIALRIGLPDLVYVAPCAAGDSWYPSRFTDPVEINQPDLDWALERIQLAVNEFEVQGIARARIALVGFSQGACLASEFVYRNSGRWGALIALTGGLIGPQGTSWGCDGNLASTPVFLGNGDMDPWVPLWRTRETAEVFRSMGGAVVERTYPGRGHEVCDDEVAVARDILANV
ncbi:hypothetical protein CIC12_20300 [Burkholderia sp. SG-MS1]|nr:hypothetical protein [Paraburkholderia sp. SG-MS1]